jgi:hypothetical protein
MVSLTETQEGLPGVKKFTFYDIISVFRIFRNPNNFNLNVSSKTVVIIALSSYI